MADPRQWEEHDHLKVIIKWDGKQYRARCPEYDLTATGKTLNEARDALWSMIEHYLALTDTQRWNEYFASVQEAIEEEADTWTGGEHVIN
jgi:predicted RNase H-like HicB family nuclease